MKRIIMLFTTISLCFGALSAQAQINVFACEPEWAALAEELGGDALNVSSATTGLQDPHHVQARPSLLARARHADMLICTGAELEVGWLPVLLRKTGNPKIQPGQPGFFMATDFVGMLDIPESLDRSEGDIHAAGNPHIQTDPRRIAEVAKALSGRLQTIDPAQSDRYAQRYAEFDRRWSEAIARWEKQALPLRGKFIVVQHKSWIYLEDWLGLKELAALEPKPGVPPTTAHLAQIVSLVQATPIIAIIHAAYQSPRASEWLAVKSGVPAIKLPFTVGGTEQAGDLFGLFDDTMNRLTGAAR